MFTCCCCTVQSRGLCSHTYVGVESLTYTSLPCVWKVCPAIDNLVSVQLIIRVTISGCNGSLQYVRSLTVTLFAGL